jgi:hypothetical protein
VHDLEVADRAARQRRVLHDGHLAGQLGQQPDRAPDDVVEVDRPLEEGLDGPLLGGRQRLDRRQLVDEQPVALVGRDPAGAGVRVGDVALVLERAMSLRTVAGLTPRPCRSASDLEPTGSEVETKS